MLRQVRLNFFFSSRRRHTRWPRDWSSDVCSSDLGHTRGKACSPDKTVPYVYDGADAAALIRSEERRVGKECRSRGAPEHQKKKTTTASKHYRNTTGPKPWAVASTHVHWTRA